MGTRLVQWGDLAVKYRRDVFRGDTIAYLTPSSRAGSRFRWRSNENDRGLQSPTLLRNFLHQHFIPCFVIIRAGHLIHRDDPFFDTTGGAHSYEGQKVCFALLMG